MGRNGSGGLHAWKANDRKFTAFAASGSLKQGKDREQFGSVLRDNSTTPFLVALLIFSVQVQPSIIISAEG